MVLKERKSQCRYVMKKTNIPLFSSITNDGVPIRKLFVSNLAARTTFKDLIKLFSKYGEVVSCFLRRNPKNRNNYAFVTFKSLYTAIRVRYTKRVILHNRNLKILAANPWHQPKNVKNKHYNVKKQRKSKSNKVSNNVICNLGYVEDNVSIQKLNDDCLMHIFLQLPIIDRIRIERVCKRWKALSKKSWYSIKKLDLWLSMWNCLYDINKRKDSICIIRKILFRCGSYLNEVNLSLLPYCIHQHAVTAIGKLCCNLETIDITGLRVSRSGIYSLINNCHNITKLSLGPTTYACDIDLQKLFKLNSKLRYFKARYTPISGRCLLHLPMETIEELVLDSCKHLQEISLLEAIVKLRRLRALTIHKCDCMSGNIIRFIGKYCNNIEELKISCLPRTSYFYLKDMLHILLLSNLKVLKLSENDIITDRFLFILATERRDLTYLDISSCESVTNVSIAAIAAFSKLEVLIINNIPMTDINLWQTSNLKKLECRNSKFTDDVIINIIESTPQLRVLDLSDSQFITNKTLEKAATITASRVNNIILKIFVGGTSVNLSIFNNVSPFLQVIIAI